MTATQGRGWGTGAYSYGYIAHVAMWDIEILYGWDVPKCQCGSRALAAGITIGAALRTVGDLHRLNQIHTIQERCQMCESSQQPLNSLFKTPATCSANFFPVAGRGLGVLFKDTSPDKLTIMHDLLAMINHAIIHLFLRTDPRVNTRIELAEHNACIGIERELQTKEEAQ
jgi:hypothetical protein